MGLPLFLFRGAGYQGKRFMPHICIIIHICRIFLVNYAVDFLILSIFKGDFSQNK